MALDGDAAFEEAMHSGRRATVAGILDHQELQVQPVLELLK